MATGNARSILLVEDNLADVKILQRALAHAAIHADLVVMRDGQQALDYLTEGAADNGRRPDLVILDLNLPRMTGAEFLRQLRASANASTLPVLALSTSRRAQCVREAYAAGVNGYLEKPREFDRFVEVLRTVCRFWLELALGSA